MPFNCSGHTADGPTGEARVAASGVAAAEASAFGHSLWRYVAGLGPACQQWQVLGTPVDVGGSVGAVAGQPLPLPVHRP